MEGVERTNEGNWRQDLAFHELLKICTVVKHGRLASEVHPQPRGSRRRSIPNEVRSIPTNKDQQRPKEDLQQESSMRAKSDEERDCRQGHRVDLKRTIGEDQHRGREAERETTSKRSSHGKPECRPPRK